MAPPSVQCKSLHGREAPLGLPNPPNDTPNSIPVIIPQTGGETSAATAASIIVPLTVILGVLVIGLGLCMIYCSYMRNQDRPVRRGERDEEMHPNAPPPSRPNRQSPDRGHEMDDRGDNGNAARPGRTASRGMITWPHHPNNDITSSTESVCGTDVDHEADIITRPKRVARRGSPYPAPQPALRTPTPPFPPPIIQKGKDKGTNRRDDRRGRGSVETLRHSRSRTRSSAAPQNRGNIGASDRDDRRGRVSIEIRRDLPPSLIQRNFEDVRPNKRDDRLQKGSIRIPRDCSSRSRSRIRTEPAHSKSQLSLYPVDTTAEAMLEIPNVISRIYSDTCCPVTEVSVITSGMDDSSETIKPSHRPLRGPTNELTQSENVESQSSDASDLTFPSVSSKARYDSSHMSDSSSFPDGRGPSASPTNITSLVSSLRSDGIHDWRDALRVHSPFGEVPRRLGNLPSNITTSRDSGKALPGGYETEQQAQAASASRASDRSISTVVYGMNIARTSSTQAHAEQSDDGRR